MSLKFNLSDPSPIRVTFSHEGERIHVDVDHRSDEGKDLLRWLVAYLGKQHQEAMGTRQ